MNNPKTLDYFKSSYIANSIVMLMVHFLPFTQSGFVVIFTSVFI